LPEGVKPPAALGEGVTTCAARRTPEISGISCSRMWAYSSMWRWLNSAMARSPKSPSSLGSMNERSPSGTSVL